ncbi:MAG: DegT/DnrJ/EryC1/StrS family aminotransferase [Myxococcales bacterium]|nr:DegT/DnrJ/EryC1/StrS family aminotransferase [Myxococcales bacterium]
MSASERVELFDIRSSYLELREEIDAAIAAVVDSHQFIGGPEVRRLEGALAEYCGTRHAIGLSSGTDALLLALWALEVGAGDEVITTPFTFMATAGVIPRLGATAVFVDIDPASFNLDPAAVEAAIGPRTKAIIAVHLFGACSAMDRLGTIAERHGLPLIEDAAQAIGATHGGRRAGSLARAGCFSLFPTKNLGAFGDGGFATTDDDELYQRLVLLRSHGSRDKQTFERLGGNFRLDAIQAAVVAVKLRRLEGWNERRAAIATHYREAFAERGLAGRGLVAPAATAERHVYHLFVCRVPRRDEVVAGLEARGIGARAYYTVPLHRQPALRGLSRVSGRLPNVERAAAENLVLPMHPFLRDDDVERVADALRETLDALEIR